MAFRDSSVSDGRIRMRRSATAGEAPAANELRLGEIAVNVADGLLYIGNASGSATPVPGVPTAPRNVAYVGGKVTWQAPASNGGSPILRYRVYTRLNVTDGLTEIREVGPNTFQMTRGETASHSVSAINANGESPQSAEIVVA